MSASSNSSSSERAEPTGEPADQPGMPRWVKVLALAALLVVVVAIILLLAGGHGPGRH